MSKTDVQNGAPHFAIPLTRVGVAGVRKPVGVVRGGRVNHLVGLVDVFVDLPSTQRGAHMSRNIEALNRTIDEHVRKEVGSLEDLASNIAQALLDRHSYAQTAEVDISAPYFRERKTPHHALPTLEHYGIRARVVATREGERRTITVEVVGMTACPCAMEGTREVLASQGHAVDAFPTITHNQRNRLTIGVETHAGQEVEADDLIDIAEASLSAPTFELLKRGDETRLVIMAHEQPRFVEDVVRAAVQAILQRYPRLPETAVVDVRSVAEESIHKHDAVAHFRGGLTALRILS